MALIKHDVNIIKCLLNNFFSDYLFTFVHEGHCAGGLVIGNPYSGTTSLYECRNHCAKRAGAGYFDYSWEKKLCSCYSTVVGCPGDERLKDINTYRILREGRHFHL